jgi:hypothetical protein
VKDDLDRAVVYAVTDVSTNVKYWVAPPVYRLELGL